MIKEQIKAIIKQYADKGERLLKEAYENGEHASTTGYWDGYGDCANLLLRELEDMQEEPVSEEFEKALAKEWQDYVDRGAATVDALEDNTQELAFAKGFYRGDNWQKEKDDEEKVLIYKHGFEDCKEQMMAKAIDGVVHHLEKCGVASVHYTDPIGAPMAYYISPEGLSAGDKVKIIVIKEN